MRAESKNRWEPIIKEAVKRSTPPRIRGASPGHVTTGTIEGEDYATLHPFMLGVDALGADDAYLVVQGIAYNYLT